MTIKGKFLGDVTGVRFGGTAAAAFTIINDTTIRATVGRGASGNVSVTNVTSTASLTGFIFIPTVPPPVIYSFSPASGVIGNTVTINGANFSSTLTDNAVFFGAVRATVTAAT